ncbi:hypothetical protein MARCHEWKA_02460 [Brevundimonas phage vB_BpoS-Marchewka]|uniref:Uncharacterized protein n=1 Tax=Brevundimonas phage vB_BpoS-Marchewka TaxID=2948604 RepID=A0A9E7SQW0_9CAUD|nr:hypothetical protein MARCHEWKA_02460 [Brevundimonas phage vB_BpoS-Marchewka]UTC29205.1 hypothetical protein BAMBUS_01230 [Brevundimonas phage vB_BpoS-Bambus]
MMEDWRAENARVLRLQGDALRRMKRASERGTGCTLTAEMVEALSRGTIGEWWSNLDEDGGSTL